MYEAGSDPVELNRLPSQRQDAPRLESKQPSELAAGDQFRVLQGWFRADRTHSANWRQWATQWMKFRAGDQWSTEDKQYLNSEDRPHIVFNRVLTILKAVAGMEINGRHEIQFIPRGTEDTKVNELLSAASKWMGDGCDAEDEESQAFENCCTTGMGWCLSGDALVRLPNTHFATTRLYTGRAVEIDLENGKQLTGTANHPVLTNRGWKRLHELGEGDYLVSASFMERVKGLPVEQFDEVETRLEDKIDAFRAGRESLRCSTAPNDFYGDGSGSKIHVVHADGLLLDQWRRHPSLREVKKSGLAVWQSFAQRCAALLTFGHRKRSVGAAIKQATFDWVHAPLSVMLRHLVGPENVASLAQPAAHGFVGATQFVGNFEGRHIIGEVELGQFIGGDGERDRSTSPSTHSVPGLAQPVTDCRPSYAKLIGDFFDWKPLLEVEARKLVAGDVRSLEYLTAVRSRRDLDVVDFAVHDVGTSLGFFVAGNIITSNTENRMSYEDDPAGMYVEESIDPREMYWDRKAKKKNLTDAKRMFRTRRMAYADALLMFPGKTKFELDAVWARGGDDEAFPQKTLEERRIRDPNTTETDVLDDKNEVTIVHAQWCESETYWRVADEESGEIHELSEREYRAMTRMLRLQGLEVEFEAVRLTRKRYHQAFLGGVDMLQKAGPPPVEGRFSWTCITGEFDADSGTWFGLVKVMEDPQRWANKWLSQVLHILNTTAKGGILAENDAFDDQREAEETYAFQNKITWLAKGALSGDKPKIMPKPGQGDIKGFAELMGFAISSIKDVTGINLELLGQQDQNQPGIVESMRKQAGMTVLATLFDSLRRFRKQVGRCRLYFIQNYLSDGRLIRVAGPELTEAVPLVKDKTIGEYDVVIDDAPTSPNQKEANWAIIAPLIGVFKEQLMQNPVLLAEILNYSPLPSRLVDLVKQFATQSMNDPQQQQEQQQMKQLQMRALTAQVAKDEGAAMKAQSGAALDQAKARLAEIEGLYKMAMADNMLSDNERALIEAQMAPMIAEAEARISDAEAENKRSQATLNRMKALRERIAAMDESRAGQRTAENEAAESRGRQMESAAAALLDMMSAMREREGTASDRIKASQRPAAKAS